MIGIIHDSLLAAVAATRRFGWRLAVLLALVLAVAGGTVAVIIGSQALASQAVPQRIVVEGCWLTTAPEVLNALGYHQGIGAAELRRNARKLESSPRWLAGVEVRTRYPRTIVVSVEEHLPVLKVIAPTGDYWLATTGVLIRFEDGDDSIPRLKGVAGLPTVRVPGIEHEAYHRHRAAMVRVVAACNQELTGLIARIELDNRGQFHLFTTDGLEVLLGEPEQLNVKFGALPAALRMCAADRDKLRFLDARDAGTFYQKWKQTTGN
jgi:cell division septal protein FtsQ